jgi:hypothetical protein
MAPMSAFPGPRQVFGVAVVLGMLLSTASSRAFAACGVQDLGFLKGVWQSQDGQTSGEERWTLTAANTWSGSAWEAKGETLAFAEALSILTVEDGSVEMHLRHFDGALNRAWEDKDHPMIFRLASCDKRSAVFDGTGDKAGEHITYRRSGDRLEFIGDFLRKGEPFRVEVHLRRARD